MKAIDIINRCRITLYDIGKKNWTDDELLTWLNAGQLAIVQRRPDAKTYNGDFLCDANCRQSLPNDGVRLIRVNRNVGSSAVRMIDRMTLDDIDPDWQETTGTDVEFYAFSDKEPRIFWVYPTPSEGHLLDVSYSLVPATISIVNFENDTQKLGIDDTFADALMDYMLFRAFSKDSEFADSAQRAANHWQAYDTFLQWKSQSDSAIGPKRG